LFTLPWQSKILERSYRWPPPSLSILYFRLLLEVEVNLRPTVSRPVCPGVRRPSGNRDQFFFPLEISFRQLRLCYFVAPSLTGGRVCNLLVQLLLGACQSSHSWVEVPQNSRPYFIVSSETPSTWRARFPYLYPPETGWPSYTPGQWIFLSPLTTRRDYGGGILNRLHTGPIPASVNLRPTVSQPVCLGVRRTSGTCDQYQSLSQSHITSDNQSASPSWCQALISDPRPIFLSRRDFF
jgi:hypothetical protein